MCHKIFVGGPIFLDSKILLTFTPMRETSQQTSNAFSSQSYTKVKKKHPTWEGFEVFIRGANATSYFRFISAWWQGMLHLQAIVLPLPMKNPNGHIPIVVN